MSARSLLFCLGALAIVAASPVAARHFTCVPGLGWVCQMVCDDLHGGMSTNPDGSSTCHYTVVAATQALEANPDMKPLLEKFPMRELLAKEPDVWVQEGAAAR